MDGEMHKQHVSLFGNWVFAGTIKVRMEGGPPWIERVLDGERPHERQKGTPRDKGQVGKDRGDAAASRGTSGAPKRCKR